MARTKITPRKRVSQPVPELPEGVAWMLQPVLKAHSNGRHAGYFPTILRYILQGLGYDDAPLYYGVRTPLREHGYAWRVRVVLYEKPADDGVLRIRREYYATTLRATFEAGIRDAARNALAALRLEEDSELRHSQFAHFPKRALGSTAIHFLPGPSNDTNGRLQEEVRLCKAYDGVVTELLEELDEMHRRNQEQEERIEGLVNELGDAMDEELEDEDPEEHLEEDPEEDEPMEASVHYHPPSPIDDQELRYV